MHLHRYAICAGCHNKELMGTMGCHRADFLAIQETRTEYPGPCNLCSFPQGDSYTSRWEDLLENSFQGDGRTWPDINPDIESCARVWKESGKTKHIFDERTQKVEEDGPDTY